MRVRARVNQADISDLKTGQVVRVGLDAYPDLSFTGTVDADLSDRRQSSLSPKVRNFIALIAVDGAHPNLMPDLTASLDVELARAPGALVVPRDAVGVRRQAGVCPGAARSGFSSGRTSRSARRTRTKPSSPAGSRKASVVARNVGAAAARSRDDAPVRPLTFVARPGRHAPSS